MKVMVIFKVHMRLSHLTLLHKGQASTRYYRWMTRYHQHHHLPRQGFQRCLHHHFINMFSSLSTSPVVIHRPPQHCYIVTGQGAGSGFSPMLPLCTTGGESHHHHHHHHNYHSNHQILNFQPFLPTSLHSGGELCFIRSGTCRPGLELRTGELKEIRSG